MDVQHPLLENRLLENFPGIGRKKNHLDHEKRKNFLYKK